MKTRTLLTLAIVAFWAVMMGFLVHRELLAPAVGAGGLAVPAGPEDSWMGLYLGSGEQVGTLHLLRAPESRGETDGVSMALEAVMSFELLGRPTDFEVWGFLWQALEVSRAELSFRVSSGGQVTEVRGAVTDGLLEATVETGGETIPLSFPVGERFLLSSGFGSAVRLPSMAVGETLTIATFDPLSLRPGRARLTCIAEEELRVGGEEVRAKVVEVETGGLTSRAWIDAAGEVLRAETPVGLSLQRITPEEARERLGEGLAPGTDAGFEEGRDGPGSFLEETAVRPSGERPFRGARRLRFRVSGVAADRLPPVDSSQTLPEEGLYEIVAEPGGTEAATGGGVPPALAPYLAADVFVQSADPRIRALAEQIATGEEDPWGRALRLHAWVFANVEKVPVMSIPSALEVLEHRRGDCNEHTVLFTALARALGIPARIAIGLVWSDEHEGFYYHAWPEVWVGGWRRMDPTLGQPLADATHVKLLQGGIETWPQLLPYLGRLEIRVEEVE